MAIIKSKKQACVYTLTAINTIFGIVLTVLSYNNAQSDFTLEVYNNNSTSVSYSTLIDEDMIKTFFYQYLTKDQINIVFSVLVSLSSIVNGFISYLVKKQLDGKLEVKDKELSDITERLTNQAQSVQLNIAENVNVEVQYVPSRIHSYDPMNEPTFELNSNTLIDSGSQPTAYPSPVEIN